MNCRKGRRGEKMNIKDYREKMEHIRGLIDRCEEVYGTRIWMCGNWYGHMEDRLELLNKFSKELGAYKKKIPKELIKKIDLKPFKKYEFYKIYGDEDSGWYSWGPQDEIITTFAFYYYKNKNFEKCYEKTLKFYEGAAIEEWEKGRVSFLERLLLT